MAELTPKVITELPELTSIPDTAAFAVSSGGSSRRTLWSTIKSAFVRRVLTGGDAFLSADYANNQPITLWQANAGNTERYGLIVAKNYIGLYDAINSTWVWRTPLIPQALNAWQIEQGGTGANNAADVRANLQAAQIIIPTDLAGYGLSVSGTEYNFTLAQLFQAVPSYSRVVIPWIQSQNTNSYGTLAGELPSDSTDYGMLTLEKSASLGEFRFIRYSTSKSYHGSYSTVNDRGFNGWLANET